MISPHNFDCTQVMDLLDDYRRNEIEPHLRVIVSEHLADCDACAGELRTREILAGAMRAALPPTTTPAHLPPKVRRAIASQHAPQPAGSRSAQLLPWMLVAAVIITVGVAMLQMHTATPLQRSTEIAAAAQDSARERKSTKRLPGWQRRPAAEGPARPAIARESAAPPVQMPPLAERHISPTKRGFSPADREFAPAQEKAQPPAQFAPPQGLHHAEKKAESPATTVRRLMGSAGPAISDQATTAASINEFAAKKTTATAARQTTASATIAPLTPPTPTAPTTAPL